jgi:hypothetical protein
VTSRAIRVKNPPRVIVAAFLLGLFLAGFIVLAVWQTGTQIDRARMAGRIVAKEFVPGLEHQVTLGRAGRVTAAESDGDYILTVEIPMADGGTKSYHVWVDKKRYQSLKIGDSFDVGPYLVHE